MSTSTPTEILLGCDPQVRVVIIEDGGNLVLQVFAESPDVTDIDALFFNLTDDSIAGALTIFPGYDESIGSNGENVTGYDVAFGSLNQMNNGAQIQESYDVRLEFGTQPYTTGGDVNEAMLTFYVDGNGSNLTADSIDLSSMTAVINSDDGVNGLALVGGTGEAAVTPAVEVVAYTETFSGHSLTDSGNVAHADGWYLNEHTGRAQTNGHNDGALTFDEVATDGAARFSFTARAVNKHVFENSGYAEDHFYVQVSIDGGGWVTLDDFQISDSGHALVGSQTGQLIGMYSDQTIAYEGGILDTATESVQFRLVSDFTAADESLMIDDVQVTVTEGGTADPVVTETVLVEEDFEGIYTPTHSENVRWNEGWNVQNGELQANGCNDGNIWFEPVQPEGDLTISFDARAPHTEYFESGGCYGDSLEVWALVDGNSWHLLDTYEVNQDGSALVGDVTGQTITAHSQTLTYEGGPLEGASSVKLVFDADISAYDENIFIDNVTFTDTDTDTEMVHSSETCEEFESAHAGDVAFDQFDGFTVTAQRAGDDPNSENDAMVFDTANPTGGDWDLHYANQGKAIIISEDNDSSDPDDNAYGGVMTFEFDEVSDVNSLTILDAEESGGSIDLFDTDGALLNSVAIPAGANNGAQVIDVNTTGVATMNVNLAGSGAVDDVCFTPAVTDDAECSQYDVTYDDLMKLANIDPTVDEEEEPVDLADMMLA